MSGWHSTSDSGSASEQEAAHKAAPGPPPRRIRGIRLAEGHPGGEALLPAGPDAVRPFQPVHLCEKAGFRFLFLSRHGETGYGRTAPYVNLPRQHLRREVPGVTRIVAWTGPAPSPGSSGRRPGLPDDLLDFTRSRPSTFYEGKGSASSASTRCL